MVRGTMWMDNILPGRAGNNGERNGGVESAVPKGGGGSGSGGGHGSGMNSPPRSLPPYHAPPPPPPSYNHNHHRYNPWLVRVRLHGILNRYQVSASAYKKRKNVHCSRLLGLRPHFLFYTFRGAAIRCVAVAGMLFLHSSIMPAHIISGWDLCTL